MKDMPFFEEKIYGTDEIIKRPLSQFTVQAREESMAPKPKAHSGFHQDEHFVETKVEGKDFSVTDIFDKTTGEHKILVSDGNGTNLQVSSHGATITNLWIPNA